MSTLVPRPELLLQRRMTRRGLTRLLGGAAGIPVAASILAACGGGAASSPTTTSSSGASSLISSTPVTSSGTPLSTYSNPTGASTPSASSSTSSSAAGQPVKGGTAHLSLISEPDSLDPAKTIEAIASGVMAYIYDSLVYIGEDRLPHPWLAEKWVLSPDGKQITFTIRSGVKFHDGTSLDGSAVKANFDRILNPATASPAKAQLGTLTSVDLVDPMTTRFNFSAPYAPFFTNISISYGGIVSPAAVQKYGDAYGHNPVGTGPFKLTAWPAGQGLTLARNDAYQQFRDDYTNKGPAYLDQVSFKIISESATQLAAFERGELDIAGIDVQQVQQIQSNSKYQVLIWKTADNMDFIEYANKAPFTDVAVRQAIAYSINRDSIVQSAFNGQATANLLPIPVGVAGWDANLGTQYGYAYDLTKAKKALTDAGYAPGSDGIMAKGGTKLSFTMLVYSGNDPLKTTAQIIQADLKKIGVDLKLTVMDFAAELTLLKKGQFDCDLMRWTWPDPVILSLLFKSPGWTNQTSDPALDKLLTTADTTLDPTKRLDAIHTALTYLLQKAVIAPICTDWILDAAWSYVKGYSWDALGGVRMADVWFAAH
ncbi:MAG TPA: ABC transporter substrate-binding protein [Thermomicrobiaceae bacterium]|nr:ABC transporter substrate-binding protein [Thermomicrobiaceae bacterium]